MAEIRTLYEILSADPILRNGGGGQGGAEDEGEKFLLIPLHSTLSKEEQRLTFSRPPPGVRKVVLSTNIAETSITIDDVVYVIDCGRAKENRYDPVSRMSSLELAWVSRASARQVRVFPECSLNAP
jgi:ATP-dependent RNA helicase DHX36